MYNIQDIIAKKRDGKELIWEEIEFFIVGAMDGTVKEAHMGAMLMACHLKGLSDNEVGLLMKAMMFSGELLAWPPEWTPVMASLQSTGSTGNKAKLILAPAMACCGLKFPILSSRGRDVVGGVLSKLSTIPGFDGSNVTLSDVHKLLNTVGCCVVEQPGQVAPAERLIRDIAGLITVGNNNAFKEACMVARVGALQVNSIVMDIPYGPGEAIKSKASAEEMGRTVTVLSKTMKLKCHVVITRVEHPVGQNIGQSLEVAEAIKCMHGDGPEDLHQLVCTLGGHILTEAGVVTDVKKGTEMVDKKIRDGSAKKKFMEMLQAQGVEKSDAKYLLKHKKDNDHIWTILPPAHFFTHLSAQEAGYVSYIDVAVCNEIMYELVQSADLSKRSCAGGIQILTKVGSLLKQGDQWAKVHHNTRLAEDQIVKLKNAITLQAEPPETDMLIDIQQLNI